MLKLITGLMTSAAGISERRAESGGSEGERDRGKDGATVGVGAGCCELCVWLEDIIMLISDDYLNE